MPICPAICAPLGPIASQKRHNFSTFLPKTGHPPGKDKQVFLIMAISCLSAWMMCPLMSFFATLLFKDSHNANFVAIWVQTTMLNYPAAFLWQLAAAGPLVRTVFGAGLRCIKKK